LLTFFAAAKKVSACPAQGRTLIDHKQIKERPKNPDQGKPKKIQIKENPTPQATRQKTAEQAIKTPTKPKHRRQTNDQAPQRQKKPSSKRIHQPHTPPHGNTSHVINRTRISATGKTTRTVPARP
jgi:hypothetical protein